MVLLKVVHVAGDGVGPDRQRRWMAALTNDAEGVVDNGDLVVSEKASTPNMSVDVSVGRAFVLGTEATATQGTYFVETDAVTNLVIGDGDASFGRIDVVVAQVRDSDYSGADDDWRLFVVAGTPSGSPAVPAIPANSLKLAEVVVDQNESTSILDADITAATANLQVHNPHYHLEVFTSSGTWTKADYPWAKSIRVRVVAGGGGSGAAQATGGADRAESAGGGGGGYSERRLPIVSAGATETVTVGAGGLAGAADGGAPNSGAGGGTSSFGSLLTATGGAGGAGGVATGSFIRGNRGQGGVGSTGDINVGGGDGGNGEINDTFPGLSNYGGSSVLGGETGSNAGLAETARAGNPYGGGAGGGRRDFSDPEIAGAAGAAGIVIVEMFG